MAKAQAADNSILHLPADSSLKLEQTPLDLSDGVRLLCDVSTGTQRPLVTMEVRHPVCDALHALSHAGVRASQRLVTRHFVWTGIIADVRQWAHSCLQYK